MADIILETERLVLRTIGEGDAELQYRLLNSAAVMEHLGGPRELYRIAANVSVDYLRKRRIPTVPLDNLSLTETTEEEPAARLYRDERRRRVLSVIKQLPECHRRVLRLRYFDDCSLAEIAGTLNCTPLAAKLRVFRAVTALRKQWRSLALDSELLAG